MHRISIAFAVFVFFALFFASCTARAEGSDSMWRSDWQRFRPAEIAFTAGLAVQVAQASFLYGDPKRNWEGGILFDDRVRDTLRLESRGARTAAATTSDLMYYALLAYPLVDVPLTGAVRGDPDVAVQSLAINLESFALAGAVAMTAERVGRARPLAGECDRDASYDRRCAEHARNNTSFVSGHTAIAFTGAGLTCAHHLHLPAYGGGAPDVTACVATMTLASASGVLRILSDNHYTTDVILGSAVGLGSGYLLPTLLHYRGELRALLPTYQSPTSPLSFVVAPTVSPSMTGLTMTGTL